MLQSGSVEAPGQSDHLSVCRIGGSDSQDGSTGNRNAAAHWHPVFVFFYIDLWCTSWRTGHFVREWAWTLVWLQIFNRSGSQIWSQTSVHAHSVTKCPVLQFVRHRHWQGNGSCLFFVWERHHRGIMIFRLVMSNSTENNENCLVFEQFHIQFKSRNTDRVGTIESLKHPCAFSIGRYDVYLPRKVCPTCAAEWTPGVKDLLQYRYWPSTSNFQTLYRFEVFEAFESLKVAAPALSRSAFLSLLEHQSLQAGRVNVPEWHCNTQFITVSNIVDVSKSYFLLFIAWENLCRHFSKKLLWVLSLQT